MILRSDEVNRGHMVLSIVFTLYHIFNLIFSLQDQNTVRKLLNFLEMLLFASVTENCA